MPLWKLYLSPRGRIGRLSYLLKGVLPWFVLMAVLWVLVTFSTGPIAPYETAGSADEWYQVFISVALLLMLFLGWVGLMLDIKRLHDLGHSGWRILLWIIPLVGQVLLIWDAVHLFFFPGQPGPNRFGDQTY